MNNNSTIIFALPGNEDLAGSLSHMLHVELGKATIRSFPDGESYVRIHSDVKDKYVILVCTLHNPDEKILPLYFLSKTAQNLGARAVCLVAPYLAYMRQDKAFHEGEAVTSEFFGSLMSSFVDSLVTVDPHLHRKHSLSELYSIPCKVLQSADAIAAWIKTHVEKPLLIGPDSESKQWVSEIADKAGAPFIILQKVRLGDRSVEVQVPDFTLYRSHTPVLVDDIISTAQTMIQTVKQVKQSGMKAPVCIGVHAVFAENAYQDLLDTGVKTVVTCNTIPHPSNGIQLTETIVQSLKTFINFGAE